MFCDTCHWYTAGEKICPHCGAEQKPKAAKDMFRLPGDVSVLDDAFMNQPLTDAPMPVIEASALRSTTRPVPTARFCGRCGAKAVAGRFCSVCGAALIQPK